MDNNQVIITLLSVSIVSTVVSNVFLLMNTCMKSIKKSKCCNSELEMRNNVSPDVSVEKLDVQNFINKLSK